MITLRHNRIELAAHTLGTDGSDRTLVLLHGLGECTPEMAPAWTDGWNGPIVGLDFTGHGRSTVPSGGGYTAEILMGDVDTLLQHLDTEVVLVGRGLGAYVALLAAGARTDVVHGAVLADGPGLSGGPDEPGDRPVLAGLGANTPPDPYALIELSHDLRPTDYAVEFAQMVAVNSELNDPIQISAKFRPPWLAAVAKQRGSFAAGSIRQALTALSK